MKIDERIEEKALYNPLIHAAISVWRQSLTGEAPMSEREFLIMLVLILDASYTSLFQELVKYHEKII